MNHDEYREWVKSINIGDTVRVATYPGCFQTTMKVKNVTKTGRIRLENGELFNNEGDRNAGGGFKRLFPVGSKCF